MSKVKNVLKFIHSCLSYGITLKRFKDICHMICLLNKKFMEINSNGKGLKDDL